jgi:hypothetical protein
MTMRSANVPLSPSSALQTTYLRSACVSAPRAPAPAQARLRDFGDNYRGPDFDRALEAAPAVMRGIIFERNGIGDAAAREGEPGLARKVGMFLRPADAQSMRAAIEKIGIEERSHVGDSHWAVSNPSRRRLHFDHGFEEKHATRAIADDRYRLPVRCGSVGDRRRHFVGAQRKRHEIPGDEEASHGPHSSSTALTSFLASSSPSGSSSRSAAGPFAQRPRQ